MTAANLLEHVHDRALVVLFARIVLDRRPHGDHNQRQAVTDEQVVVHGH